MSIAGHVSAKMLARYSHVRGEARRKALDALAGLDCKCRDTDAAQSMVRALSAQTATQTALNVSTYRRKQLNDRPETWVTVRTGHMGYTFSLF